MESESKATEIKLAGNAVLASASSITRVGLYCIVVTVVLGAALVAGISIGSLPIATRTVIRVLASQLLPGGWVDLSGVTEGEQAIVWLARTPRVLVAACVGASLAVAGAQMQGLFRNPLASPDIIGSS